MDEVMEFTNPFEELDNGCNIEDGIVFINGEIERGTLFAVMSKIRACLAHKEQNITIVINSEGGDEFETMGIVDFIQSLPVKVNIIARGVCMSAAVVLLCYATGTRTASPRTVFMIHGGMFSHDGSLASTKSFAKFIEQREITLCNELASRTKLSAEKWMSLSSDEYFDAEAAKTYGIIDTIV